MSFLHLKYQKTPSLLQTACFLLKASSGFFTALFVFAVKDGKAPCMAVLVTHTFCPLPAVHGGCKRCLESKRPPRTGCDRPLEHLPSAEPQPLGPSSLNNRFLQAVSSLLPPDCICKGKHNSNRQATRYCIIHAL